MSSRPAARIVRALAALALGTVVSVVVVEAVLRVALGPGRHRVWTPGLTHVFEPDPAIMPGVEGPSRFAVGVHGFRGGPLPDDADGRVLALGGSTTECLYLDQAEAWPALLERALAERTGRTVWVGNAGKSGRNTRDHVVQLRRLLPQHPELDVVLLTTGVNDLGLRLSHDDGWAPVDLGDPAVERALLPRAFDVLPRADAPGPAYRRTELWRLAARVRGRAAGTSQDDGGAIYTTWRAHRASAPRLRTEPPDLGPALEELGALLRECARLCREHGVELVLVTQPALWRADLAPADEALLWLGGVGDFQAAPGAEYYTAAALAAALARYAATTVATGASLDVPVLDLAADFPRTRDVFYDDVHFDEAGARLVAERVAAFVAGHLPAPRPNPR